MKPVPKALLIIGIIILVGAPFAGLLFTVLGMVGAFHDLGQTGISDPNALAGHVGQTLFATLTGLLLAAVVGLPLIIVAVVLHLNDRPAKPADKPPLPPTSA